MKRPFVKTVVLAGVAVGAIGAALRLLNGPRKLVTEPGDATPVPVDVPAPPSSHERVIGGEPVRSHVRPLGEEPVIGAVAPPLPQRTADDVARETTAGQAGVLPLLSLSIGAAPAEDALPGREIAQQTNVQAATSMVTGAIGGDRPAESFLDEGNVYFNVGQYALAVERYSRAIEIAPDLIAAYYNRANAYSRAQRYDEALADYDQALELEPDDADALNNRGMLHLYREDFANAIEDFDAALAINPEDATVAVNRGLARLKDGDADGALDDFDHAASIDPDDGAAAYGTAQATASLGRREEALLHVTRAIELDPHYAREAAGDPYLKLLEGDEAFLKLLRASGKREPDRT